MRNDNLKKMQFPEQQHTAPQPGYSLPTDFVDLPSKGRFYSEDHPLHNKEDVEVTFMTTKEEDILTSPAYNKKGVVFDKLIESVLVDKRIKSNTLLLGDKSAIIINARKNAYGSNYKIGVECDQCFHQNETTVDLEKVTIKENEIDGVEFTDRGTFILTLPKTQAVVEVKLLTSEDEVEITKKAEQKSKHHLPESPATDRLRQMILTVNGNSDMLAVSSFITTLPIADSRYVKKIHNEITPDIDFKYKLDCEECGATCEGGVPILGTFFWPDE